MTEQRPSTSASTHPTRPSVSGRSPCASWSPENTRVAAWPPSSSRSPARSVWRLRPTATITMKRRSTASRGADLDRRRQTNRRWARAGPLHSARRHSPVRQQRQPERQGALHHHTSRDRPPVFPRGCRGDQGGGRWTARPSQDGRHHAPSWPHPGAMTRMVPTPNHGCIVSRPFRERSRMFACKQTAILSRRARQRDQLVSAAAAGRGTLSVRPGASRSLP